MWQRFRVKYFYVVCQRSGNRSPGSSNGLISDFRSTYTPVWFLCRRPNIHICVNIIKVRENHIEIWGKKWEKRQMDLSPSKRVVAKRLSPIYLLFIGGVGFLSLDLFRTYSDREVSDFNNPFSLTKSLKLCIFKQEWSSKTVTLLPNVCPVCSSTTNNSVAELYIITPTYSRCW